MSPIKKLPLKVRYARGKVRHLASPLIWFPLGIICLLGVLVWELSVSPELLEEEEGLAENNVAGEELSADEVNAIAADIDSSAFLLQELEKNQPTNQSQIAVPTNVLEEYMQEKDRDLRLLERTQKELNSIYENTQIPGELGSFGENENPRGSLNLENNSTTSNPKPFLPPSFNLSTPEFSREETQERPSSLEAAMQEYLDSSNSSELLESEDESEDLKIENTQLPGSLPNNQNYANPGIIDYSDRYDSYNNNTQQNQPYYTNLNPNPDPTINTPQNQPYYSDIYGNNYGQSNPTRPNYPNLVPVTPNNTNLPNNPYSRTGSPYSGNSPYSANQGASQFPQNRLNNGANYYQGNYGTTQQPQPYNNIRTNPFNKQFGQQNNPLSDR